eukprot:15954455-Heterocapsa_arctica.AAC.1
MEKGVLIREIFDFAPVTALQSSNKTHDGTELVVSGALLDSGFQTDNGVGGIPHRPLVEAQFRNGAGRSVVAHELRETLVN